MQPHLHLRQEMLGTLLEGMQELKQEISWLRAEFWGIKLATDVDGAKGRNDTPNQVSEYSSS